MATGRAIVLDVPPAVTEGECCVRRRDEPGGEFGFGRLIALRFPQLSGRYKADCHGHCRDEPCAYDESPVLNQPSDYGDRRDEIHRYMWFGKFLQ